MTLSTFGSIGETLYGKQCTFKRKPRSLFCKKCHMNLEKHLNGYIKKTKNSSITKYHEELKTLLETGGDQNEILSLLTIIDDV